MIIRKATIMDAETILDIRNHPTSRAMSDNTSKISLENHLVWFKKHYIDGEDTCYVGELDGRVIGYCRFDKCEEGHEVSIAMALEVRGQGLGRKLLKDVCNLVQGDKVASIKPDNIASMKIFQNAGFTERLRIYKWSGK
mgnify:CR=1 FL=1|jgi:L-amino acid N-acyltransferase YncA|tara:strand:+ start:3958 stop:4374 length:417 start_codon:yes stop_codon:yes gene_type:complete